MIPKTEILLLENTIWFLVGHVGVPIYDFTFREWFHTKSPSKLPTGIEAVARVGAVADYERLYSECTAEGVTCCIQAAPAPQGSRTGRKPVIRCVITDGHAALRK